MEFSLRAASGRNNHIYTAINVDGHAIATVFKVGEKNQDADYGMGAYRIRLSRPGEMDGHRFLVDSHNSITEKLKEILSCS
ncbi:hypothetical protein MXF40_09030 [Serratia marcescens]|uniref:hypothetical protein n=1 Tax=Serratia marcescens TaxID=615 RepID=UPI002DBB1804|nr:hypothetical protein [Serratia marcescens]MEB6081521.1 hypothetical protein [Serratia marcescens]